LRVQFCYTSLRAINVAEKEPSSSGLRLGGSYSAQTLKLRPDVCGKSFSHLRNVRSAYNLSEQGTGDFWPNTAQRLRYNPRGTEMRSCREFRVQVSVQRLLGNGQFWHKRDVQLCATVLSNFTASREPSDRQDKPLRSSMASQAVTVKQPCTLGALLTIGSGCHPSRKGAALSKRNCADIYCVFITSA
jgi:hypothetical protein